MKNLQLNLNNQKKIAIIGAGITGLYLAWKIAKAGYHVTVFEKKDKIGKEVCSGLFSERIIKILPEAKDLIEKEIRYCLIHFPKKTLKIKFLKKFFLIDHFKLDNLVAELAKKAGVEIVLKHKIESLDIDADYLIGCDGALSDIRKKLKLPSPKLKLGIQGFIPEIFDDDFVETWPTKNGFIWKIPRKDNTEYGIMEEPKKAKIIFDSFLKENHLKINNLKSALIPQGLILPFHKKIALVGDAMGLTKPWSGGGVVWSLISAEILLKNFPDFLKYNKAIKKIFLPEIIFSKLAKKIIYFLGHNFFYFLPRNYKIDGDFFINRHF